MDGGARVSLDNDLDSLVHNAIQANSTVNCMMNKLSRFYRTEMHGDDNSIYDVIDALNDIATMNVTTITGLYGEIKKRDDQIKFLHELNEFGKEGDTLG